MAPPTIKERVLHNLSVVSGRDEAAITDDSTLEKDLGLTAAYRGALAKGFEAIARETNPGATITVVDCKKLKTAKQCVSLVESQATPPRGDDKS